MKYIIKIINHYFEFNFIYSLKQFINRKDKSKKDTNKDNI
jgi:hypothetical protein